MTDGWNARSEPEVASPNPDGAVPVRAPADPAAPDSRQGLRSRIRAARRARSEDPAVVARDAASFARSLTPLLTGVERVVGYAALPGEPDLDVVLDAALDRGTEVLLPVVLGPGALALSPLTGPMAALPRTGAFGIREPSGPRLPLEVLTTAEAPRTLVLVPGLAFSPGGGRLGNGGGFYDRAFGPSGSVPLRGRIPTVGVCFRGEVTEAVPIAPWDLVVDRVVTEVGALEA